MICPIGYNIRKAAQVVAFYAQKQGGTINVLKLTKLVYLTDREFLRLYDRPVLFDDLKSLDHGPVNSITLNFIDGNYEHHDWDSLVTDRENHQVGVVNPRISMDELDELSDAEVDVLESVWKQFGWMDKYQIRDWTHKNCPEWEHPHGSAYPIPYERIFRILGKNNSTTLGEAVEEDKKLQSLSLHYAFSAEEAANRPHALRAE